MRSLGLDIGDKRTGVALSDALGMLANPLVVLERQDEETDIRAILQIVKQYQVEHIIVGIPQSLNGTMGAQAEKVRAFGEILKQHTTVPVEYRDERLSTVSARRMMQESGRKKPEKKKVEYDAAAAAIILQSYLDETRAWPEPPE